MPKEQISFQELIFKLQQYWAEQGCVILQPLDMEVGAATFHPATFLRSIGPSLGTLLMYNHVAAQLMVVMVKNPNRGQHYYQFQVMMKPSPLNIQDLYIDSLRVLGIDPLTDDIRFVEDNWEAPTLGAWGLGWEVWQNGMEISQFTYFQQVGGLECAPIPGEITYGLERIAMYLQGANSMYDLVWTDKPRKITYSDVFLQNEVEMSNYNFKQANVNELVNRFIASELECQHLLELTLSLPAYEMVLKASHIFNLLDARGAISVSERQNYILRIRALARAVAENYYKTREKLGFPMLTKNKL